MSSDYPVVTQGQTIRFIRDLNKVFMMDIVETKPSEVIEILNADINVDLIKHLIVRSLNQNLKLLSESKSQARDIIKFSNYKINTDYDSNQVVEQGTDWGLNRKLNEFRFI